MNEEEIANLITKLSTDSSEFTAGMEDSAKKASDTAGEIEASFNKVSAGTIAAGTLIANAVTGIASKAYEMGSAAVSNFAEAELGAIKLNAAVEGNGGAVQARIKDYNEFAGAIQRMTTMDDDATLALLQQAETLGMTGDAAKRATKNAIALQAARGISAQAAIRMTTALENGNAQMLTRMLPTLRNAKSDTEKVAMAHKLLGNMFKVAEAEAGSISGAYKQMSNEVGNTMESLGQFVSENVGVVTIMQTVRDGLVRVQEILPQVFSRIQPILDRIKDGGKELFNTIMEKGQEFASWAEPIFYEVTLFAITAFNATKDVAVGAWGVIQDTVASVWAFVSGSTDTTFEDVKTFIVEALIAAEFAMKNFDQVAALTWVNIQLGAVSLFEDIKHFFMSTIPELLSWFGQNWEKVFFSVFDLTTTVFINMGQNIRNAMTAIWDYIASGGTKTLEFAWTPLTEGFFNAIDKLPELTERGMTEVEKSLKAESENLANIMGEEFSAFHEQRMGEINAGGLVDSLAASKDAVDKTALDLGEGAGKALGKGMKDGAKIEGAAVGSADAMARILATQEALKAGKITAGTVGGGPGGTVAHQSNLGSGGSRNNENRIETYLKELVELARAAAQKDVIEVEPAGLV